MRAIASDEDDEVEGQPREAKLNNTFFKGQSARSMGSRTINAKATGEKRELRKRRATGQAKVQEDRPEGTEASKVLHGGGAVDSVVVTANTAANGSQLELKRTKRQTKDVRARALLLQGHRQAVLVEAVAAVSEHAVVVVGIVVEADCAALLLLESATSESRQVLLHLRGARTRRRQRRRRRRTFRHRPLGVFELAEGGELLGRHAARLGISKALREADQGLVRGVEVVVILRVEAASARS